MNKKKAFTIVELVIVIAVIAILMAIGFLGGSAFTQHSREVAIESQLKNFESGLRGMYNDNPRLGLYGALLWASDDPSDVRYEGIETCTYADIVKKFNTYLDQCEFTVDETKKMITSSVDDPYGHPYEMMINVNRLEGKNSEIRICIKSYGENKASTANMIDKDDMFILAECANNSTSVEFVLEGVDFGASDNAATANDGRVVFTASNAEKKQANALTMHISDD